jgi:hypothetical protein
MPPLLCTDIGRTKRKIIVLKIGGRLPPIITDVEVARGIYVQATRAVPRYSLFSRSCHIKTEALFLSLSAETGFLPFKEQKSFKFT